MCMSAAFTSAPAKISCCTTASWPFRAARCRGVLPSCKQRLVRGLLHRLAQCTRQNTTPFKQIVSGAGISSWELGLLPSRDLAMRRRAGKHQIRAGPTLSAAPTLAPRFNSSRAVPAAPPYAAKCNGTHPSCDKAVSIAPTPASYAGRLGSEHQASDTYLVTRVRVHASAECFSDLRDLVLSSGIVETALAIPHCS